MSLVFLEDLVNNADVINNVGQFLEDTTASMSQQARDVVGGIVASEPAKRSETNCLIGATPRCRNGSLFKA